MIEELHLVSILMTAYNREKYIAESIESVLAQTYSNFELIIVDDSSKDNTVSIARSYAIRDSRIRVFINENNLGDYPNRNMAAKYATGKYLMYLDSDDTFLPNALEYVMSIFSIFDQAEYATIYHYKDIDIPVMLSSKDAVFKHFFRHTFLHFGPSGTVVTRNLYNKIEGFPELYGPANDMYYNIQAASNSNVILMPFNYLNYRIHDGQELNNHFSYLYNGYLYFNDIMKLPELPITESEKSFLLLKNKRRFIINTIKYFVKHKNLLKVIEAYRLTKFTFLDFLKAIFH